VRPLIDVVDDITQTRTSYFQSNENSKEDLELNNSEGFFEENEEGEDSDAPLHFNLSDPD
jgi:hypothetical protein